MGGYLYFFDSQLGATSKFEVGTAAVAQRDGTVDFNSRAALAASSPSRCLDDLEHGAHKRRSVSRDIETEANRIGNHARKFANLEQYPSYLDIPDTVGYRLNDALGDRELVHHQDLIGQYRLPGSRRALSRKTVVGNANAMPRQE